MSSSSLNRSLRLGTDNSPTTTSPVANPAPYVPRYTPDQYVRAIAQHAQQSNADTLYGGEIYRSLKRFFDQESNQAVDNNAFIAYLISPHPTGEGGSLDGGRLSDDPMTSDRSNSQGRSEGFTNPEACIRALKSNIEISQPQVLFLRGHPSPTWLSNIGAFCHVDPELFRWFLRYRDEPGGDYYFGSSPASMSNIFRFKIFTIGSKAWRYGSIPVDVDRQRSIAASSLRTYQAQLRGNWGLNPGDSIVRNFHLLDDQHFVIEQEIVFHIFDVGKTWMAIACTDEGRDLPQDQNFSSLGAGVESSPTTLLPIVQYRQRCALECGHIGENANIPNRGRATQSLSIFPEAYGHDLDWSLAESDRTYILSGVFRLAAFSQRQLLNVMEEKVLRETDRLSSGHGPQTSANLLYLREMLQSQLCNVSYMMKLIEDRGKIPSSSGRSMATTSVEQKTAANSEMMEMYSMIQELHSHAILLREKCTQGMTIISDNRMFIESQRAVKQGAFVTKLTLIACLYLPMTVTSGFFGINVQELGSGKQPIWVFLSSAIPLTIVTTAFMLMDSQIINKLR